MPKEFGYFLVPKSHRLKKLFSLIIPKILNFYKNIIENCAKELGFRIK